MPLALPAISNVYAGFLTCRQQYQLLGSLEIRGASSFNEQNRVAMTRSASRGANTTTEKMDQRMKRRWAEETQRYDEIAEQARGLGALARARATMESQLSSEEQRRDLDERPFHWTQTQHAYTQATVHQQNEQLWALQRLQHDEHLRDANQGTLTKL